MTSKGIIKSKWHEDYRTSILRLNRCINATTIRKIQQNLYDNLRNVGQLKEEMLDIEIEYNQTVSNLSFLLIDRDIIYNTKRSQEIIKELNEYLRPWIHYLSLLLSLATMFDGMQKGSYGNNSFTEIVNLQEDELKGYLLDQLQNDIKEEQIYKKVLLVMAKAQQEMTFDKIDKLLIKLYKLDSKDSLDFTK